VFGRQRNCRERYVLLAGVQASLADLAREGRLDDVEVGQGEQVEPDGHLADDEVIAGSNGLRVIHTAGHSPGHVVLLHEPTRTLLTGDAVFHRGKTPSQGPAALSYEPGVQSLRRLPVDVSAVGFAHGAPLTGAGVESYQDWLTKVRSRRCPG
jgi:glyoxylase-like metal-dependent hydrolase (beta-lactamase superfamily II)